MKVLSRLTWTKTCSVLLSACLVVAAVPFFPKAAAAAVPTVTFQPSGFDGGGFQSVVAADPNHQGVLLDGADVSGIFRSTSTTWPSWVPVNNHISGNSAFTDTGHLKVAAITFAPGTSNLVYAGVGSQGTRGGFMASTDGGQTWAIRSTVPQFNGGNPKTESPVDSGGTAIIPSYPRNTGNLIALDETNGYIYAATYQGGLMRNHNNGYDATAGNGTGWDTIGLSGAFLRSLVIDPSNSNTLYVSTYDTTAATDSARRFNKVYKITNSRSATPTVTVLSNSPNTVKEMVIIGGVIYAAAGADGIYSSADGGATWNKLYQHNTTVNPTTRWMSITGYTSTGGPVLFAGAWNPPKNTTVSTQYDGVIRSLDGGATWTSMTQDDSQIKNLVDGPGGSDDWWLLHSDEGAHTRMGDDRYASSYLVVDPYNANTLYSSGKAGVWRTDNATAATPTWYPASHKLNVSNDFTVISDPTRANGTVHIGNVDWNYLYSTDHMQTVNPNRLTSDTNVTPPYLQRNVTGLALDSSMNTNAVVYIGTGDRNSNTGGEVYANANPLTLQDSGSNSPWVSEGLAANVKTRFSIANVTKARRVMAVAANQRDNGSGGKDKYVIAAVENGGVWQEKNGTWSQVTYVVDANTTDAMAGSQATRLASMIWNGGSSYVYLYDKDKGVFRSNSNGDAGSWQKIFINTSVSDYSGHVLLDPSDSTKLYVSADNGLYRIDSAETVSSSAGVKLNFPSGVPGPIAFYNGNFFVATPASSTNPEPHLYVASASDVAAATASTSITWTDITATDPVFRGMGQFLYNMDISNDGYIYMASDTDGLLVGQLSGGDTTAPTAPTVSSPSHGLTSVDLSWSGATDNIGITSYDLYKNGSFLTNVTGTTKTVSSLTPGTSYSFYVKAKDAAGNASPASNTVNVTTTVDTTAPTAPTLSSPSHAQTTVNLSWSGATDNVGVTSYDVYKNGSFLTNTASSSYIATGLSSGTSYSFYVIAKDASGNSSPSSNTVNVTTDTTSSLLTDDFEDGNATGWTATGTWSVVTDGSTQAYYANNPSSAARSVTGTSSWTNYAVQAQAKVSTWNTGGKVGVMGMYTDSSNYYYMVFEYNSGKVSIYKRSGGTETALARSAVITAPTTGVYHTYKLQVSGSTLNAYIDGTLQVTATDSTFTWGTVGLYSTNEQTYFDNVQVQ
ncbi:hypothetical protein A8709_04560 [Paenibacillus pectinilyticus]|uniref:Fibronectin type-III domain-containing protein n=1 Tax=Paenibacillus pectinilyticus TaxID=512399 RepID=A0A1C0ZSB7_9BACL|nr:fibronectin type III domain-containing protein [Paenibacillus pectinilyticus]OCT10979.1 hypothetical protein A8709_04560 [Paenibacillus pectinilyticus]